MKKHFILPLFIGALALGGFAFAANNNPQAEVVKASEELSLHGEGDNFALLDKSFDEDESFVYTADLHFKSGQAAGLAFGAEENDHYFVINMDRFENHVKLLYFKRGDGAFVDELYSCDFLGHGKLLDVEWQKINPKVRDIENINIKLILTREDEHAYVEFFVEGIKRFGIDTTIDLNNLGKSYSYHGGYLGMNCFNADVYLENIEIGKSDYSYFSEPYRNQYHLQPFAKWTNDPNALCYFNGWYHVFYQTNPFGLYWSDMFWGHARSRDLIHWEFLPVCLFPEVSGRYPFGDRDAYMWSGCAIAYYHGMSALVDSKNWFVNGDGDGLLAIYTRDGAMQDQEVIYSDDEGLTWVKTGLIISQTLVADHGVDWRDPKVFPLTKDGSGKVTTWGMTLSGYRTSRKGYFLKSTDLINWNLAGDFFLPDPECVGVGFLTDNNGVEHAYLTNKSRTYILGTIEYDGGNIIFKDETDTDISTYSLAEMEARLKPLDFGPDTYASQSFYITDENSEYCGKEIVLNWFSGDLNADFCTGPGEYANLRGRWNGGWTIPVEYGVVDTGTDLRITQKPITVDNTNLAKTTVVNIDNQGISSETPNPLSSVQTHIFELDASLTTNSDLPITFKVDVGDDEYMEFGWNSVDGYYVDRTNLDDKGINTNVDWHVKYASHIMGESDTKTFYVLSDNGGLEVFCENYSISFYFVTTAAPYSTGASLKAGSALINHLRLNEIKSVYRDNIAPGEGVLYVSTNEVSLDTRLNTSKFVGCWYSGTSPLSWEEVSNDGVVSYTASNQGINFRALKQGTATFKTSVGETEELITVNVYDSTFDSEFSFSKENIVSGEWIMSNDFITGEKLSGNGFLLANETGDDFTYTGQFDIVSGVAASLVFRAAEDMSSYLVANYDANEKVVKLWSTHGELTRSGVIDIPLSNIALSVKANARNVIVTLNGHDAINYTLPNNEPTSGHFGLNVFSARANFKSLSLIKENYDYVTGEFVVPLGVDQYVVDVYNLTLGNTRLESGFYYQTANSLCIKQDYFELINNGLHKFKIVGSAYTIYINVNVNTTHNLIISDLTVESGVNVNVYVGNHVIASVSVNGEAIDSSKYYVHDYVLTISHECFKEGENEVLVNGSSSFVVTVNNLVTKITNKTTKTNYTPLIIAGIVVGSLIVLSLLVFGVLIIVGLATGGGAFAVFAGAKRRKK